MYPATSGSDPLTSVPMRMSVCMCLSLFIEGGGDLLQSPSPGRFRPKEMCSSPRLGDAVIPND